MEMDITIQMRTLVEELNRASDAYYNGRGELMTDYEWDAKFDQLKQLESQSGVVLPDSPTHRVSADTTVGKKEEHEFSALSLAKTKQPADLVKWAEGRPIWMSWKLDGLTLVVTYDEGQLTKVVTRGDGHIGTNITHLAQAINGIPATIHATGHVVVRGEAVISYEDFERFNLESDEEYANPRNLASGSLTLKDPREVAQRHIRWIPFTLVHTDEEIPTWGARMDWLKRAGLGAVDHERIDDPTLEHVEAAIERWTEKVTKRENPYPVDGLVIVYDDAEYAATGSVTGHHATRAGYAFKWADESASTELDHVEWSCAASTISPVAVFRPVELEGTTVKRASLCNISECERLGMGGKGTLLEVIKANKIIPKVIKVKQAVGPFCIPDRCPVCGSPTRVDVSPASGTKTLHCTHAACPAKQLRKFARFVSKQGVNVDGISEQTLQKFINLGWIRDYADIFDLPTHAMENSRLGGLWRQVGHQHSAVGGARSQGGGAPIVVRLVNPPVRTGCLQPLAVGLFAQRSHSPGRGKRAPHRPLHPIGRGNAGHDSRHRPREGQVVCGVVCPGRASLRNGSPAQRAHGGANVDRRYGREVQGIGVCRYGRCASLQEPQRVEGLH